MAVVVDALTPARWTVFWGYVAVMVLVVWGALLLPSPYYWLLGVFNFIPGVLMGRTLSKLV